MMADVEEIVLCAGGSRVYEIQTNIFITKGEI